MNWEIAAGIVLGDVIDVVSIAVSLGATTRGGPLSIRERQLVGWAKRRPAISHSQRLILEVAIGRGEDPLGEALMAMRSREARRRTGSFYTPPEIVVPMVDWILAQRPDMVVDPGCGSGRFAATVARKSPRTQILAIDKDPVATLIARATLAVLRPDRASVQHRDFLADDEIRRGPGRRIAWVGNPPYVRHHLFSRALKERGIDLALKAGHESVMTVGLHALFFTKTKLLSEPGDVGCYVTAGEWVDNRSGRIVRDLFLNGLGGEAVLLLDPQAFAFAGVKTTAAITSFVVASESSVRKLAINVPLAALASGLGNLGNAVPTTTLSTVRGWSGVARNPMRMPDVGPTIGDLFEVHRGTATGANGFFVMTPEMAKSRGLTKYGVPTVTRAREIIDCSGALSRRREQNLVISLPKTLDRRANPNVETFLRAGEREGADGIVISKGSNAQKRSPWWSFSVSRPAIVATYMARRPPVFAANPERLGILNIAIAIEPKREMDAETIERVVLALNRAAPSFEEYAVRYFGNLRKFEPKVVASLPLPPELHDMLETVTPKS